MIGGSLWRVVRQKQSAKQKARSEAWQWSDTSVILFGQRTSRDWI